MTKVQASLVNSLIIAISDINDNENANAKNMKAIADKIGFRSFFSIGLNIN